MSSTTYPKLYRVRQTFPRPQVADVPRAVTAEMNKILGSTPVAGKKIGITVGSRGIQNIVPMLQAAVKAVRGAGAEPVLLAAMGSHGGGTEAGQREILDSLGITEQALGAPVITCAKGREIGVTPGGLHAYMLESAFAVDAIIPFNRVKTHTSFKGDYESGLFKKLVVGLGGPQGARQFHSQGRSDLLSGLLRDVGTLILQKMPVLGGVAIVENAYEETAVIKAILKADILREETALLNYSKTLMPGLPVRQLDILIIEEMGKNYSGTGMDTNIVGRLRIQGELEPTDPFARYLAVWDLSEQSHGNACGIGLADFTTQKLVSKMDRKPTYLNCLTATFPIRAKIPLYLDTEEEVFQTMLRCLEGSTPPEKVRLVVVPNTLFLTECFISEALLPEVADPERYHVVDGPLEISFTKEGETRPRLGSHG